MKQKFKYLWLIVSAFLFSCSNEDDEQPIANVNETPIVVSINLSDEISITEEALTRSTPTNDIYGINIYYDKNSNGDINQVYAYGLFDNKEDMSIALLSGHKYRFECTLVKNGKQDLFFGKAFNNTYNGFAYPFQTNKSNSTMIENKFDVGSETYLTGIKNGSAHMTTQTTPTTGNATNYASLNRFYGEVNEYTPQIGGTVSIALKRVVFGARFIIKGVEDGTLTATCGSFWKKVTTTADNGTETLYTFPDVYNCWKNEMPLTEEINLSFVSNRGSWWNMTRKTTVTFKRNVMTTVTIDVTPDLSSGVFNLTEEPLGSNNYINMEINADGLIDVVVNPEH